MKDVLYFLCCGLFILLFVFFFFRFRGCKGLVLTSLGREFIKTSD